MTIRNDGYREIPAHPCPGCGTTNPFEHAYNPDSVTPEEDLIGICGGCGTAMLISTNHPPRVPTDEDLKRLDMSQGSIDLLTESSRLTLSYYRPGSKLQPFRCTLKLPLLKKELQKTIYAFNQEHASKLAALDLSFNARKQPELKATAPGMYNLHIEPEQ